MNYFVKPLLLGRLATAENNIELYSNKLADAHVAKGTQFYEYCMQQLKHWQQARVELIVTIAKLEL